MRRTVLASLLLMLADPGAASADVSFSRKTIKAQAVYKTGDYTTSVGCVSVLFAQWKDVRNTTAERWDTVVSVSDGTKRPVSGALIPPYDDKFEQGGAQWSAPAGFHRTVVAKTSNSGNYECGEYEAKHRSGFASPIKITLLETKAANITGYVDVKDAWPAERDKNGQVIGFEEQLPGAEASKILASVRMKAKGPKKTFSAPVIPYSEYRGHYTIKVPVKQLGHYTVSAKTPNEVALDPERRKITVRQGETKTVDFDAGYNCKAKPPGLSFLPGSQYGNVDENPFFAAEYRCVSRRAKLYFRPARAASWDDEHHGIRCTDANGTVAYPTTRLNPGEVQRSIISPALSLAGGEFTTSDTAWFSALDNTSPLSQGSVGPMAWKAIFQGPDFMAAYARNDACGILIGGRLQG